MSSVDHVGAELRSDRFRVTRAIGEGGMGLVYEAFDRQLRATVALKTLRSPTGDAVRRLKREFRALQRIRHRNLVEFGELFQEHGAWFFTMELVDGTDLLEHVWLAPRAKPTGTTVTAVEMPTPSNGHRAVRRAS